MQPLIRSVVLVLSVPLSTTVAQSGADIRAFTALRASHLGALTPLMTPAMISRRLNGAQLGIRYGLVEESGVRTQAVAGSGIFAAGTESSITVTAGVTDANCDGCAPALLLGLGGDLRLYESSPALADGSGLTLALSGDIGYAQLKPGDDNAIALGVGAPVTVALGSSRGMRFAAYATPIFGIGQTSTPCPGFVACDKSGTRWILGGGLGVWNSGTNISASIGINQVMLSGTQPVYGINVVLGGR